MKIFLSPMDYYFFRRHLYTIQFVFEYAGHLDVGLLTDNLCKTASACEAISSRLKILSRTEIIFETGFPIPVRSRHISYESESNFSEQPEDFLDPISNTEGEPLVKVLVTYTPTRSYVGFSFSHMLGDGSSFFLFLDCLSKISRKEHIDTLPSNRRELLTVDKALEGSADLFESTGYITPRPSNPKNVSIEKYMYSMQELKSLKQQCEIQGSFVSTNDILMADLAKRFHHVIPAYRNKFIVRCPVDYRKTMDLPSGYFGNAVRDAVIEFDVGEVDELPVHEVALRIRKGIASIDQGSVRRSLQSLQYLRQNKGIEAFEDVGCPGLLVSNLSKFPIQKINLGIGPPVELHHASLNPRLGLILAAAGGIEVRFKRPLL